MLTVQIDCGLGNQMFEYAAALAAARRSGDTLRIDANKYLFTSVRRYELSDFPNIAEECVPKSFCPLIYSRAPWWSLRRRRAKRSPGQMHAALSRFCHPVMEALDAEEIFSLDRAKSNYLVGFWQNVRYFSDFIPEVRQRFEQPPPPEEKNRELLAELGKSDAFVSLHVRRGDYSEDPDIARAMGNICTGDYYRKAVALVKSRVPNARFVVFSDGMEYARTHLGLPPDSIFVDWNGERSALRDLQLMAGCSHHIIANSTFSWWGAFLGRNAAKTVCAPAYWQNGVPASKIKILPEDWLTIA